MFAYSPCNLGIWISFVYQPKLAIARVGPTRHLSEERVELVFIIKKGKKNGYDFETAQLIWLNFKQYCSKNRVSTHTEFQRSSLGSFREDIPKVERFWKNGCHFVTHSLIYFSFSQYLSPPNFNFFSHVV